MSKDDDRSMLELNKLAWRGLGAGLMLVGQLIALTITAQFLLAILAASCS